ncbi:MAG: tetratricopeptide repeat protein [Planctomycetota bacterium]
MRWLWVLAVCALPLGCVLPPGDEVSPAPELVTLERAEAWYKRGLTAMAERRYGDAVVAFNASLREFPTQYRVHYRLGRCQYQLGNYDLEILEYRKCLALNPQHKNALYHLGSAYTARDEIASARDCFRQLVALAPGDANAERALLMLEAVARRQE